MKINELKVYKKIRPQKNLKIIDCNLQLNLKWRLKDRAVYKSRDASLMISSLKQNYFMNRLRGPKETRRSQWMRVDCFALVLIALLDSSNSGAASSIGPAVRQSRITTPIAAFFHGFKVFNIHNFVTVLCF